MVLSHVEDLHLETQGIWEMLRIERTGSRLVAGQTRNVTVAGRTNRREQ